jgi:hypothetical protein
VVRFLPLIVVIVLHVYCWIEVWQSDPRQVRELPRGLWALLVAVPFFGPVAWLVFGRPNGTPVAPTAPRPQRRMSAPDDDPDFLRSLRRPPPDDDGSPLHP